MRKVSISVRVQFVSVAVLLCLSCAAMRLSVVSPRADSAASQSEGVWSEMAESARQWIAPTRKTVSRYERVAELLGQKQDRAALLMLANAQDGALVVRPMHVCDEKSETTEEKAESRTPSSLLIDVARAAGSRARAAAASGNAGAARQWLAVGRRIAEQALATPYATIDALMLSRSVDALIGRAEQDVARQCEGEQAAQQVAELQARMSRIWQDRILARIEQGILRRNEEERDTCARSGADTCAENLRSLRPLWQEEDHRLAGQLLAIYRTERARLKLS